MPVYRDHVADYVQAGWPCVMPVPSHTKHPPPTGYTGADGIDTDPQTIVDWAHGEYGDYSIALRMPDGVIGIDVDHYDKVSSTGAVVEKRGGDTIAALEAELGALPATWRSSARPAPSGIRFYRVPSGRYRTKLPDVEIIQRHHRYAVVAPSINTDADGATYGWTIEQFSQHNPGPIPRVDELPFLQDSWVAFLREGATEAGYASAGVESGMDMLHLIERNDGPECAEVTEARTRALRLMTEADAGGRHDTAIERVHHLVMLGAHGHPGVGAALAAVAGLWEDQTAGEDRQDEWERMLLSSARKAVTAIGQAEPVSVDPCLMVGSFTVARPAPIDDRTFNTHAENVRNGPEALHPEEIARYWSPREIIGAHAWDPRGMLDHTLADSVLERTHPILRYAVDAGTWILRGPERWEARGDLTKWAVHELASLMPHGDSSAEKGSPERNQADRRARIMTTSGRSAVAQTMTAAVAAGTHPCSVELGQLDTEPYLLWAGGQAWDLRACQDGPVAADIDLGTPHLNSASVTPRVQQTPLWDAFLAAVWPAPELRAWALRVLSITLTGYPDAALPILLGIPGSGKSSVVDALMSVLGNYAHAADARLLSTGDNSHASIVYALKGRRLSAIDEGPRGGRWATERLKQITGGTALTGNRMRENPVTFQPTHTLVLTANDEPVLTDEGLQRRVRLIPCDGDPDAVEAARQAMGDLYAGRAWRAEAPGVLAGLMREAALWMADRRTALTSSGPAVVRELVTNIGKEQDPVRQWLESETEPHPDGTLSGTLHQDFVAWCRRHETRALSLTAWGTRVSKLGYPSEKRRDRNYRPLRTVTLGGWSPLGPTGNGAVTVSTPVRDHARSSVDSSPPNVDSCGQLKPPTVHAHNPRSDPPQRSTVDSVDSYRGVNQNINKSTPYKAVAGEGGGFLQLSTDPLPDDTVSPGQDGRWTVGAEDPSSLLSRHETVTAQTITLPSPNVAKPRATRGKLTDEEKASRKAAAADARRVTAEEKRTAAVAEAAGRIIPLPAILTRQTGELRSVTLAEAVATVRAGVDRSGETTIDVETSGRPIGHRDYRLRTIQLGDAFEAVVFPHDEGESSRAAGVLLQEAPELSAFSAAADIVPVAYAGLIDAEEAWAKTHDVVISAKLADPQSTGSDADGLKDLSRDVLGGHALAPAADKARALLFKVAGWLTQTKASTPPEKNGWAQVDHNWETMVRYDASDVLDTAALRLAIPEPAPAIYARERLAERVVSRVALEGVRLDGAQVVRLQAIHRPALELAAGRVRAAGVVDPGSDKQLVEKLTALKCVLPHTAPSKTYPQGQASVAKDVLAGIANQEGPWSELISAVLEYRKHETALGTFLAPYHDLVVNGDGRARPVVYTLAADTGRMSCVRPNLQQVPREGGFRACITADPGELLISADFSGVEIRVLAALSQCADLLKFIEEEDAGRSDGLHWLIAREVWGPDATYGDRYLAKRGVFGFFYGQRSENMAKTLGIPEAHAAAVFEVLRAVAPGATEWADDLKGQIRRGLRQFPTYSGRVVHLDPRLPHKGPNFAIQGTARELLIDALVKWVTTKWGAARLLPVHDEVVAFVSEADAPEATAALVSCMESDLYGVKIAAEASEPSFAWQDAA